MHQDQNCDGLTVLLDNRKINEHFGKLVKLSRVQIIIRYIDTLYWTGFKLDIIKKNELVHKNLVHTYMNLEQGGP